MWPNFLKSCVAYFVEGVFGLTCLKAFLVQGFWGILFLRVLWLTVFRGFVCGLLFVASSLLVWLDSGELVLLSGSRCSKCSSSSFCCHPVHFACTKLPF